MVTQVSFKKFLETGCLGPLAPHLNLSEVARLMGPPSYWEVPDARFPIYWDYSDLLGGGVSIEIFFEENSPHQMHWFQLEAASYLSEVHKFGSEIVLLSDGFSRSTAPSEFLSAGVSDPSEAHVGYGSDHSQLCIAHRNLTLFFDHDCNNLGNKCDLERSAIANSFGMDRLFAEMDSGYAINSIYSFPRKATLDTDNVYDRHCDGRQYLDSLGK